MKRLFKSRRGVNDVSILAGILGIILATAIIIPLINAEFNQSFTEFNVDGSVADAKQDAENVSTLNAFTVLLTVFKLMFWDFGDTLNLPFFLDAFYTLLALLFIIIVARNIWIGGGG